MADMLTLPSNVLYSLTLTVFVPDTVNGSPYNIPFVDVGFVPSVV